MKKVNIPIGISNFREMIAEECLYCDKTDMIADFLNRKEKVTLITRPRRWGKTLNLSMLQHFLSSEVNGLPTTGLFNGLNITRIQDGLHMQQQGQHPVIFFSFKDIRDQTSLGMVQKTTQLIRELYGEFESILKKSQHLPDYLLTHVQAVLNNTVNPSEIQQSIKWLSQCLYLHYQKPVYILIDEYDAPLNVAYQSNSLEETIPFFRDLLSATLKDNPFMARGVLTGILRVAKDSIFSGLNHLHVCTVMDDDYGSYFGFTEPEVHWILQQKQLLSCASDIKFWYNGYRIGQNKSIVLYNPWSILSCLLKDGQCDLYWVHTASNDLIQKTILEIHSQVDESLAGLLAGETVEVSVKPFVQFFDLARDEKSFWGLLLSSGYLTAESSRLGEDIYRECRVRVPNEEILRLFNAYTRSWLKERLGFERHNQLLEGLLKGEPDAWVKAISSFLKEVASYFDLNQHEMGESFYHGFCLGLVTQLYDSHRIRSNRETGEGRCDLFIVPKTSMHSVAWVIEFKHASKSDNLLLEAQKALAQIKDNDYLVELQSEVGVKKIIQVGVAFSGKKVMHVSQVSVIA